MLCAIRHHLYNLKSIKNIHGKMLLLVTLQASVCNFTKSNTPRWALFTFFNIVQMVPNRAVHLTFIGRKTEFNFSCHFKIPNEIITSHIKTLDSVFVSLEPGNKMSYDCWSYSCREI